jgi:hypothetical protein
MPSHNPSGRPAGTKQRPPIDLPDGDRLVPHFTTFAQAIGLNAKSLQRIRHRVPVTTIAGIVYVIDGAAREALANPATTKKRGRK